MDATGGYRLILYPTGIVMAATHLRKLSYAVRHPKRTSCLTAAVADERIMGVRGSKPA